MTDIVQYGSYVNWENIVQFVADWPWYSCDHHPLTNYKVDISKQTKFYSILYPKIDYYGYFVQYAW